jgi:hypothetical protein
MLADVRYALRLLKKSPWFTALTVLVLAGGLGISLYTFAALNMMMYRDLPVPDGGAIVRIGYGESPNVQPLDAFERASPESLSTCTACSAGAAAGAPPLRLSSSCRSSRRAGAARLGRSRRAISGS